MLLARPETFALSSPWFILRGSLRSTLPSTLELLFAATQSTQLGSNVQREVLRVSSSQQRVKQCVRARSQVCRRRTLRLIMAESALARYEDHCGRSDFGHVHCVVSCSAQHVLAAVAKPLRGCTDNIGQLSGEVD